MRSSAHVQKLSSSDAARANERANQPVGNRRVGYRAFDQLDGDHPWSKDVPEGSILYPVRRLKKAKVSYFNFALAKEMGLLDSAHPDRLTAPLTEKILSTFALRIINEWDVANKTRLDSTRIKPKKFMATRYLQLQHPDKAGRTSGDGRCIWNGIVSHAGRTWDVSSRGTGVTALAPGAVQSGQPLKSGNVDFGYGCGMAENDELFGAALLAEIFHRNGVPTERMLAVLDIGGGFGIGVRAAPNLLRPAHIFSYLKQNRREPLVRALDYLVRRQYENGAWNIAPQDPRRFERVLTEITKSFARFAARLERDYIFAWFDWDGDNVLVDAGIIDYGSVRQFGLRHDQYRYDDVERFSTTLNEQREKTRGMLQTFAQAIDFAQTGRRKPSGKFRRAKNLREFDAEFSYQSHQRLLEQAGYSTPLARLLLNRHRRDVAAFAQAHESLERSKTYAKSRRVPDGMHRPAIFNMRLALAKMGEYLDGLPYDYTPLVSDEEFHAWILASTAKGRDRRLTPSLRRAIRVWQMRYLRLLRNVSSTVTWEPTLRQVHTRASRINGSNRMTGNALIYVVDALLARRRQGASQVEIQRAMSELIEASTQHPERERIEFDADSALAQKLFRIVDGFREDI